MSETTKTNQVWIRIEAFLSLKSPNTQKTYSGIINEWCDFVKAEKNTVSGAQALLEVTDLEAISYINWQGKQAGHEPRLIKKNSTQETVRKTKKSGLESNLANSTIAKKVAALRRMYRMLVSADLGIKTNPFDPDKVQAPKARSGQKRPTEMIDFNLVKEIVSAPDPETPKGIRDRAILAIMFSAGLRKNEVLSLRLGDVRKSQGGIVYLRLRATKSNKDADQPLPTWAVEHLEPLIKSREEQGAASGDFLFTGFRGRGGTISTEEALSESGMHKLFKSYCRMVGASHYATPHSARATAITKLLTDGFDHKFVQKFSRHSSTQMVDVYDKRRLDIEDNPGLKLDY